MNRAVTQVNYDNLTDDIVYDKVYEKFKNIVKVPNFKKTIPRNSRLSYRNVKYL